MNVILALHKPHIDSFKKKHDVSLAYWYKSPRVRSNKNGTRWETLLIGWNTSVSLNVHDLHCCYINRTNHSHVVKFDGWAEISVIKYDNYVELL